MAGMDALRPRAQSSVPSGSSRIFAFGLLQPHVEDQRLAGEERRKLGIHREMLDLDQRLAGFGLADTHVIERHRGKRDQAGIDAAVNDHRLAHDPARLALEILAEVGPVDEQRGDQRGKQRHDQKTTDERPEFAKAPVENPIPFDRGR